MDIFSNGKPQGDHFIVSDKKIDASVLLGNGYAIPKHGWEAEMQLPHSYEVAQFGVRELWDSNRFVSWMEVDILLNMDPQVVPVGWRVIEYFYHNQDFIPLPWLEHLANRGSILFPYAVCVWEDRGRHSVACPAFFFDIEEEKIDCQPILRTSTGASMPIAVYQL